MTSMTENSNQTDPHAVSRRRFLQGSAAAMTGLAAGALRLPPSLSDATIYSSLLQGDNVIDVTGPDYGAKGDGSTDDRAAFQAAIDDAIAQGKPLVVPAPPQFYRIILSSGNDKLDVHGDLTILGDSRSTTLIRFGFTNASAGKVYGAFYIRNGSNVQMSGLRLEEDVRPSDYEFAGVFMETGVENHMVLIESVDIDGFTHCLYSPSGGSSGVGELFLTVRRCDLSPYWQYCIAFWTPETGHKRLHVYDSYLHDNQESHLVYCHPHNSVHVENCRFDGAAAWAFQIQGTSVGGDPDYQRFIGCWFGPRNSRGIITQDRETTQVRVEIRNCIFEGRPAIQIRSEILIDGCYFTTPLNPPTGQNFIAAYSNAPWKGVISNCVFSPRANSLPDVDLRLENIEVSVLNCQFYTQGSGNVIALGGGNENVYTIADCLFYTRQDSDVQNVAIDAQDGKVTIDRCRFVGRSRADRGMVNFRASEIGPGPDARIQIDNCLFQSISGGGVFGASFENSTSTWSNKIFGSNNRITNLLTAEPILNVSPETVAVYGQITPASGMQPSPLSAAALLVVTSNYDTFQVIGSAEVNSIHWWHEDGRSNAIFSGTITLIASNGLTLVSGGNIDLAGASQRVVQPGEQIRLAYRSDQQRWTEQLPG